MHIHVLIVVIAICCVAIGAQEIPPFPVLPSAFSTVIEVTRVELVRHVNFIIYNYRTKHIRLKNTMIMKIIELD
jgi:hypothetical protein